MQESYLKPFVKTRTAKLSGSAEKKMDKKMDKASSNRDVGGNCIEH